MKSCRTMLRISTAYAAGFGARIWKGTRCGIFLTIDELQELYTSQGFNRHGSAMRKHLYQWMETDRAVLEGSSRDPTAAVWFECPKEKEVLVMVRSEQCGGRYVTRIDRMDWAVLRQMHELDQEVLA